MFKRKLAYLIVAVMALPCFTGTVEAKDDDYISLPVQLYDYDADGLFYEYALYNGMDTFGLGESNNEGVTTNLVNRQLGKDGLPVYTKQAIEEAAKTIHKNLLSQKSNADLTKYSIFKKYSNMGPASGSSYGKEQVLGENSNYFYDRWDLEGTESYIKDNGLIYSGKGLIWAQDGDGIVNYGIQDHLKKKIAVEANTEYTFKYYQDTDKDGLKFDIIGKNGILATSDNCTGDVWKEGVFNTGTDNEITIDIYRKENTTKIGTTKIGRIAALSFIGNNKEIKCLSNADNTNFLTNGDNWKSTDYEESVENIYDRNTGNIFNGISYWKQVGDGVACLKDSSIVFNTDIPANQYVNINYFLGYDGYKAAGITIDLLDNNNKVLSTNTLEDKEGGEYTLVADANKGEGTVKVRINGKAGSRIAAIKINPVGSVLPLGDYEETVRSNPTTVDGCKTCMDYAYLRLNNFFNTKFYLNKKTDIYKQMLLKKNIREDGEVEYTFDSKMETVYDNDKAVFYNDGNSESKGFFPLDSLLDDTNVEKLLGEDDKKHNYHFGMNVDGDFIYKKGSNQFFNFSGDDDVYVFINGERVIDLGGAHKEANAELDIEEYASQHGIKNGEKCHFQMFYLERHTTASNCKIQTNLKIGNHAEHKFISGTEGKELPQEILNLVPVDENEYFTGDRIQVGNKNFNDYVDLENKGIWKFVGWDKEEQVVTDEDVQFVGQWVFIPDDFKVKYNFISGTKGKDLPQEILDLLPKDIDHLTRDEIIEVENNFKKEIRVKDGVWKFKTWDKDSITIENQDEYFNGVWEFIPNEVAVKTENNNSNKKQISKVKTGDDTSIFIFISMLLVSFLGVTVLFKKKVR